MFWELPTVMRWNVTEGLQNHGDDQIGEGSQEDLQF
jgi:hypothetical protein